jgi:hypothetical protein
VDTDPSKSQYRFTMDDSEERCKCDSAFGSGSREILGIGSLAVPGDLVAQRKTGGVGYTREHAAFRLVEGAALRDAAFRTSPLEAQGKLKPAPT